MSNSILKYLPLAKKKTAHEYAAPCPQCGGNDRFTIWPDRPKGGAYLCRGCNAQGDGIEFLKQFHSLSYPEACKALGLVLVAKAAMAERVSERQRGGQGGVLLSPTLDKAKEQVHTMPTLAKAANISHGNLHKVEAITPPPLQWRTMASQFLTTCQTGLDTSVDAVLALTRRYLCPDHARAAGIGWNPCDRYELRSAWGLDPVQDTNGKIRDKLLLPAGIVIASRRRAGIMGLTIRRAEWNEGDKWGKYHHVKGGSNTPYVMGRAGLPVIMLESALDAALLHQEAGDLCATVALHGNMKGLDADTAAFIKQAPLVIACPDSDDGGRAAWLRWRESFPFAVPIPALGGKDVGEMHRAALTLDKNLELDMTVPTCREWCRDALYIARSKATGRPVSVETQKSDLRGRINSKLPIRARDNNL